MSRPPEFETPGQPFCDEIRRRLYSLDTSDRQRASTVYSRILRLLNVTLAESLLGVGVGQGKTDLVPLLTEAVSQAREKNNLTFELERRFLSSSVERNERSNDLTPSRSI